MKDLDVEESQQTAGIQLTWTCEDMIKNNDPCKNIKNELVTFNQSQLTQTYEPKILTPYSSYRFALTGTKSAASKQNQDSVIIIVVELDTKPLLVNYPQNIYLSKINTNDDLQINIEYAGNPDDYSLFMSIFYKLEIVAAKKQNFTSFAFQIWDLFSAFEPDSNEVLIRVSLYDPKYFMPLISTAKINLNFEPLLGTIEITPTEGDSLDTVFTINVGNFYDEDAPLSYRFFYYFTESLYAIERELGVNPVNSRRDFLEDTGFVNQLQIKLPGGQTSTNAAQSMRVLLMVSVIDSLGAVTNVTRILKVAPKYPSLSQQVSHYAQYYSNI